MLHATLPRSASISMASYDTKNNIMLLTFRDGCRRQYREVAESAYNSIIAAEHPGHEFRENFLTEYEGEAESLPTA